MGRTSRKIEEFEPTYAVGEAYEKERLERIEQNRALLAKLGLINFSLSPPKPKRPPKRQIDTEESQQEEHVRTPSRKSPRIQQMKPRYNLRVKSYQPIYAPSPLRRVVRAKVSKTSKTKYKVLGRNNQGRRFYGGRIYDSEIGTTCHQCRQKTIEEKVQCTNVLENGMLCKVMMDERCLIGRYGETLEEARSSGEWNCPKCRGVCNCSFCRRKKGLPATGILKHLALAKGYNSVMEYLGDA